jgi:pimeloyl-ACP methyl ester carboxylesterase
MDHLTAEFGLRRFVLVGLCSGAVFGHHVAARDPRVVGVVFLDGYVFPTLRSRLREAIQHLRQPFRLLRGALRRVFHLKSPSPASAGVSERDALLPFWPSQATAEADLAALREREVSLLFIFSGEWARYAYEGQMRDALHGVGLGDLLAEARIEEAEHLYFTRRERDRLRHALVEWLGGGRFSPAGPASP